MSTCKKCGMENALSTDVKCWNCGQALSELPSSTGSGPSATLDEEIRELKSRLGSLKCELWAARRKLQPQINKAAAALRWRLKKKAQNAELSHAANKKNV